MPCTYCSAPSCHACTYLLTSRTTLEASRRTPSEFPAPCKKSELYSCVHSLAVTSRTDGCFYSHGAGEVQAGEGGGRCTQDIPSSQRHAYWWAAGTCNYTDRKWHLVTCARGMGRVCYIDHMKSIPALNGACFVHAPHAHQSNGLQQSRWQYVH